MLVPTKSSVVSDAKLYVVPDTIRPVPLGCSVIVLLPMAIGTGSGWLADAVATVPVATVNGVLVSGVCNTIRTVDDPLAIVMACVAVDAGLGLAEYELGTSLAAMLDPVTAALVSPVTEEGPITDVKLLMTAKV